MDKWNPNYKNILLYYLKHKYNLPEQTSITSITNNIMHLRNNQNFLEDVYRNICDVDKPIGSKKNNNITYVNHSFIDNNQLQLSSFFEPIDNYAFHHSDLGENMKIGKNPYTRLEFDNDVIRKWIQEVEFNFPISTINDSLCHYPYIFDSVFLCKNNNNKYKIQCLIDYVEKFFY